MCIDIYMQFIYICKLFEKSESFESEMFSANLLNKAMLRGLEDCWFNKSPLLGKS